MQIFENVIKGDTRAKNSIDPNIDDVVLVHDEKLKRSEWKMGRIIKLLCSKDGKCRAAEVIVISNGKRLHWRDLLTNYILLNTHCMVYQIIMNKKVTLERPINKLYPLEYSLYGVPDNNEQKGYIGETY